MSKHTKFNVVQAEVALCMREAIHNILKSKEALKNNNPINFMELRDTLKVFFDDLENKENENYIGIVEWAVIQSVIENIDNIDFYTILQSSMIKFANHPNINML